LLLEKFVPEEAVEIADARK